LRTNDCWTKNVTNIALPRKTLDFVNEAS
jgi:hypothetical protein